MDYLKKLQEKCKLTRDFMEKLDFLFEKLVSFGYIDKLDINKLEKKLYNNIDAVFFTADKSYDFKTGYYDAIKKELYIKDTKDLESMFLRVVYALTTTKVKENTYHVGYSTTSLSTMNYKQEHTNFGLNRAIVSNLVCRLLYTEPTTLSIVPTYRTYKKDFLGNGIESDNNIYFLEGQILKQLCYSLNIQEEDLYYHLFINPNKFLNKCINKVKTRNPNTLFELLDTASKYYSNYNKLLYLNLELDNNYIASKKRKPDEKQDELVEKERETILYRISKAILEMRPELEDDDIEDVSLSLTETINDFEEKIINTVISIQNILVESLLNSEDLYSPIEFLIKQKQLSSLLIYKNEELEKSIYNTLTYKILNSYESSSTNRIEKIKYSIASEILSSEKYIKIYSNMEFNVLNGLDFSENEEIVALSIDGTFLQLLAIKGLNLSFRNLVDNTELIKIDNLKFLLNSPMSIKSTNNIEKVYTYIKENFEEYKNLSIENLFITNILDTTLVIVLSNDKFEIFKMDIVNNNVSCIKVPFSEKYSVFDVSTVSYKAKMYKNHDEKPRSLFSFNI